ncbi:MAG: hypothetical protein F6J86_46200 [Symploca sp. SIO1B1]|nr:hypothetical protein [Symploca sp. SIO1C2]NES01076.1 hypothetical protein [Symploca sp. SIO1B1]
MGIGNWELRKFVGAGLGSHLTHVYDNFGTKPAQWPPLTHIYDNFGTKPAQWSQLTHVYDNFGTNIDFCKRSIILAMLSTVLLFTVFGGLPISN